MGKKSRDKRERRRAAVAREETVGLAQTEASAVNVPSERVGPPRSPASMDADRRRQSGTNGGLISQGRLDEELAASKAVRRTSPFLQELTFQVVDAALTAHYPKDHAIRCLQAAAGVQRVLSALGIAARLYGDALCVAEVSALGIVTWGGYWGTDHHIWAVTQFNETVDLALSRLHLHPSKVGFGFIAVPAFWWQEEGLPETILYLPNAAIVPSLPPEEDAVYKAFLARVDTILAATIAAGRVGYAPILRNAQSFRDLLLARDPWVLATMPFYGRREPPVPFPTWVEARLKELEAKADRLRTAHGT